MKRKIRRLWAAAVMLLILSAVMLAVQAESSVLWNLSSEGVLTISGSGRMEDYSFAYHWDGDTRQSSCDAPWWSKRENITSIVVEEGIEYIGNNAFHDLENAVSVSLPATLTGMGEDVFYDCTSLAEIDIPSGMTEIPKETFRNCTSLSRVDMPSGVTRIGDSAFSYCKKLYDVAFPAGLQYVGKYSFYNSGIRGVKLPYGVTSIGDEAFSCCTWLVSVSIPNSVTYIGKSAFSCTWIREVTLPDGLTSLSAGLFNGCQRLTSVVIPASVKTFENACFLNNYWLRTIAYKGSSKDAITIRGSVASELSNVTWRCNAQSGGMCGDKATWTLDNTGTLYIDGIGSMISYSSSRPVPWTTGYCASISRVVIAEGITTIGEDAFSNCSSIVRITIPSTITYIADSAFFGCSALEAISLPDSVNGLGMGVFENCISLTSVVLPGGLKVVANNLFMGCTALESITLPASVTEIYSKAFSGCTSLSTLNILGDITYIGDRAFFNCASLGAAAPVSSAAVSTSGSAFDASAAFSKLTHLGEYAFAGCTSLESFSVPASLTAIPKGAFSGCTSLRSLSFTDSLISVGADAFAGCTAMEELHINNIYAISRNSANLYASPFAASLVENRKLYIQSSLVGWLTLPEGWKYLQPWCLYGINTITTVTLPETMEHISTGAFSGCSGITDVYAARKTGIGIAEGNDALINAVWHCSEEPEIPAITARFDAGKDLTAVLDESGTLTISGTGSMQKYSINSNDVSTAPWIQDHANDIKRVVIESGVTGISQYAFYRCGSIESVSIADTVTSIDTKAFYGCAKLSSVVLPEGLAAIRENAFHGCINLSSVVFPESLKTIYAGAFAGCVKLSSMILPDGLTTIYADAFYGCTGLKTVVIGSQLTTIPAGCFDGCKQLTDVTLGSSVTSIEYRTFQDCTALEEIVLPASVTTISSSAFSGCTKLKNVYLNDGLEIIGTAAFKGCTALEGITLPGTVTTVYASAFSGCTGMKNIILPDSVTLLGESAFLECTSLESVRIGSGLKSIAKKAFYGCTALQNVSFGSGLETIGEYAFSLTDSLLTVEFGDNIVSIGDYAFKSSGLTSVIFGNGIETIGFQTFQDCAALEKVTFGNSLTQIGDSAFYHCVKLGDVTFPGSLTAIGNYAFSDCSGFENITIPAGVTTIGGGAFEYIDSLKTVTFEGSLPSIGYKAFYDTTANRSQKPTATYPCGDDSWENESALYYVNDLVWEKRHLQLENIPAAAASCTQDAANAYSICHHCESYVTENNGVYTTIQEDTWRQKGTKHPNKYVVWARSATCTEPGFQSHLYCPDCESFLAWEGRQIVTIEKGPLITPPLAHASKTLVEASNANCYSEGNIAYYKCDYCDACFVLSEGEYIEKELSELTIPRRHAAITHVDAKDAGCGTEGWREHMECEWCHQPFSLDGVTELQRDVIVIFATGLHPSYRFVAMIEPKCHTWGMLEHYECTVCGKNVLLSGDTYTPVNDEWNELGISPTWQCVNIVHCDEVPATCGGWGLRECYKCVDCGTYYLKEDGEYVEVFKDQLTIEPTDTGHSIVFVPEKPATCSHWGTAAHYECEVCGKSFALEGDDYVEIYPQEIEPSYVHTNIVWVEAKAPSCYTAGWIAHYGCAVCGAVMEKNEDGEYVEAEDTWKYFIDPPYEHAAYVWVDETAPTCGKGGVREHLECPRCGQLFLRILGGYENVELSSLMIPAGSSAHHLVNGACRDCQKTFDLTGLNVLRIPASLTVIGDEAFMGTVAQAIVVPQTCTSIGNKAFASCPSLRYIFLPAALEGSLPDDILTGSDPEIIYQ